MSVQGICDVTIIDDPKIIKSQFSPAGKPFLRLKFDHVTIDITTNLAEMIGGVGTGVRLRMLEDDKGSIFLEREIGSWSIIEKKHFEDYASHRSDSRLYAKAQMVVAALRHYKIEYERTQG